MSAKIGIIALKQIIVKHNFKVLIAVDVALFAVLFEYSFVGLAFGTRFPDFTEVPRARYIDQEGVWLGMLISGACVGLILLPLFCILFNVRFFSNFFIPSFIRNCWNLDFVYRL